MTESRYDLASLIHPVSLDTFRDEYWEKKPLVIHREVPGYFDGLMSLRDLDELISSTSIRAPLVVTRGGENGGGLTQKKTSANDLIDRANLLERLYSRYRNGATINLHFAHEQWTPLKKLCQTLASELSASFHTNIYLTPPNAQGLDTHYDTHDVFVLQTVGCKRWRLYDSPFRLPTQSLSFKSEKLEIGEPSAEFDLHTGDLLYIPRGWVHDARTLNTTSAHITLGVHHLTWEHVLRGAIVDIFERDGTFRASLPIGFNSDPALRCKAEEQLSALIDNLCQKIDPTQLIDEAAEEAWQSTQSSLGGHLVDLVELERLGLDTTVTKRLEAAVSHTKEKDLVFLRFNGKKIELPADLEKEVQFITRNKTFAARDLPGGRDDRDKLELVQHLVMEGLLTMNPVDY
ncbi:cupin [Exilibacterium tricleocarpae]|uniref:Cupin n=1 Tax=Exilibacterium tricleocarpae TaxID=2591008 RepID=A0A545U494_9GAMM|nr:cupin domain-containing protein [Exilibacterium tricleocarpae]TQV84266.1 cupin [Exilibacterium tricleocarpae]